VEARVQDLVIGNGPIVTLGSDNRIITNGAISIRDGRIQEVGEISDFIGKYPGARFIDARGRLIMPGFINTHMHFYSSFARGMALDGFAPKDFQQILEQLWWRLDKALNLEDTRYSALTALTECIRKGTTTVIDHHASPNAVAGSLDAIAEATLKAGIRACLCYEVSDRDGKDVAKQGLEENQRFIQRCQSDESAAGLLSAAFGLHASFTVDDDTLKKAAAICEKTGAPVHVHTAEGMVDVKTSLERFGARPVARFERAGLLSRTALLGHCVHLDESEHDLLAQRPAWVLHNPQSNMNNAVGTAPIPKMIDRGVKVTLGTDAMTNDMLQELRVFALAHKASTGDPLGIRFDQIEQVFCRNNARLASEVMGIPVGTIAPGAAGDVVLLSYVPPTPLTIDNFLGHLLFGMVGTRVDTTIADGQVLMEDGVLQTLDEAAIAARSRELAPKMWQRID